MATNQQVALSRSSASAHRHPPPPSIHEKTKPPPAFIQKLYEMLNEPKSVDLIRWSDPGDSFFVLDHERLAREVLPRWFKHQNFSSFVRQLNMYGFHKIPHLQQGVLKSDNETEFWNFAHAKFLRGRPDLLYYIQRKKQPSQQVQQQQQQADDAVVAAAHAAVAAAGLVTDGNGNSVVGVGSAGSGSTASSTSSSGHATNSQILDVNSIVQGIAAIKRHQAAISAELSELKRSNEMLWQDALLAREKHQKQEDTINKIVKFLAGVFGKHATGGSGSLNGLGNGDHHGGGGAGGDEGGGDHHHHHHEDGNNVGENIAIQRRNQKRARLMIEDGRRQTQSVPPLGAKSSVSALEIAEDEKDEDVPMLGNASPILGNTNTGSSVVRGGGATTRNAPPSPMSTLNLSDREHRRRDSMDHQVDTPMSVNTPLPPSSAESNSNKKELAPLSQRIAAITSERAFTHTPPIFHPQAQMPNLHNPFAASSGPVDNNNNSNGFPFDPRNLMLNLSSAQIQHLLTALANHTIPDSVGGPTDGSHYESGFVVPLNGNNTDRPETRRSDHLPGSSPTMVDFSSYLVPSPQLSGASLVNNGSTSSNPASADATGRGTASSTTKHSSTSGSNTTSRVSSSTAIPTSTTGTTQADDGSTTATPFHSTHSHSRNSSTQHIPDGLIAFDGPEATASNAGSNTPNASVGTASPATSYAGDLSVGMRAPSPFPFPYAAYQGYGAYPSAGSNSSGAASSAGANGTAENGAGYAQGYSGYSFPYASTANGGWNAAGNASGGAGASGDASTTDFTGLFSPVLPTRGANSNAGNGGTTLGAPFNPHYSTSNSLVPAGGGGGGGGGTAATQSHLANLVSSWNDAEDIDRDVNALNNTIHSLIQTLGLDPSLIGDPASVGSHRGENGGGEESPEANNGANFGGAGRKTNANPLGSFDFETLLNTWGASNGGNGLAVLPSDARTSGSSSTPSTGEDIDGSTTSVTSGGGAEDMDDLNGSMSAVNSPAVPHAVVTSFAGSSALGKVSSSSSSSSASPAPLNRNHESKAGGPNGVVERGGTSPPRPINKKARTGLTGSAATSAGLPTAAESVGPGRKRRSTVITAPSLELDGAVHSVGGTVEPAHLVGHEPTPGAGQGVQTRSNVKPKRRRG